MRLRNYYSLICFVFIALFSVTNSQAELDIIVTGGADAIPISIVPFESDVSLPTSVEQIINADLKRSGRFKPVDSGPLPPGASNNIVGLDMTRWSSNGVSFAVIGNISQQGPDYKITFRLFDTSNGKQEAGLSFTSSAENLRSTAHQISDAIYEAILNVPGAFDTRIVYVTTQGQGDQKRYMMQVADSDGFNALTVLTSKSVLMSPSWSPDATNVSVVSFENNRSSIYVQNLLTGQRKVVSNSRGINGAPAWSPDGSRLAVTLSKTGTPQIYVINIAAGSIRQITNDRFINTEAAWMPNGQELVYTSNRTGGPQIYKVSANGGSPKRMTFEGDYNSAPSVSPDGKKIAVVTSTSKGFGIGIVDVESRQMQELTNGGLDESPSFAPNGDMVIYATKKGRRGVLAAVSSDGRVQQTLVLKSGEVREPDWSPFLNR